MKKKKSIIFTVVLAILAITSVLLGEYNLNFFFGIVLGVSVILLLTHTVGRYLLNEHVKRIDKLERDYYEEKELLH